MPKHLFLLIVVVTINHITKVWNEISGDAKTLAKPKPVLMAAIIIHIHWRHKFYVIGNRIIKGCLIRISKYRWIIIAWDKKSETCQLKKHHRIRLNRSQIESKSKSLSCYAKKKWQTKKLLRNSDRVENRVASRFTGGVNRLHHREPRCLGKIDVYWNRW